jgi:large subunit ribosomal protein L9
MLWVAGSLAGRLTSKQALCPLADMAASRVPSVLLSWSVGGVRGPKQSNRKIPVILVKDFPNLGFRGEEVAVRPGYARNFLIPQQVVVYSTIENKADFMKEKDEAELKRVAEIQRVNLLLRRLAKIDLTIKRHVNQDDKIYGSVTAKHIAEKLAKADLNIPEQDVMLAEALKVKAYDRTRTKKDSAGRGTGDFSLPAIGEGKITCLSSHQRAQR